MTDQDDYLLCRNYSASVRLNAQHTCWTDMFGYLLHPIIPVTIDPEGLSLIDVGTGTGVWLFAMHQQLKTPINRLLGIDISDSQFPHPKWLPEKMKLIKLDALDPNGPPEELRGKFDVVNARFLMALVKDTPDQLIDFFSKLVKPGGYLQWGELCNEETKIEPGDSGGSTENLRLMMSLMRDLRPWEWLDQFEKNLKPSGFEIVTIDRRSPHPWQRRWYVENWCMAVDELALHLSMPADKLREINAKAIAESKQGAWIRQHFQTIVARKKL